MVKNSLHCASTRGAVCMTGMLAEQWPIQDFAPMEFIPSIVSLTMYDSGQIGVGQHQFQRFIKDVEALKIKVSTGCIFKLEDIAKAHQLMDSNNANGKIVIITYLFSFKSLSFFNL